MAVRCVVFDIGGVLEVTPETGWVGRWEAALGLGPGGIEERLGDVFEAGGLGRVSESEVTAAVAERLGLAPPQVEAFLADLWAEYLGALDVELVEYLRSLRPRYRTALLSNSFVGAREREHELYGFGDLTDVLVYSHEVGLAKPDPEIYALTCRLTGVEPDQVLFLDDSPAAIEGARRAGWRTVRYESTPQAIAEIEAHLAQDPAGPNGAAGPYGADGQDGAAGRGA